MKKWVFLIALMNALWGYEEIKISNEQLNNLGIKIIKVSNKISSKGLPFNAYIDFDNKSSTTQSSSFDAIVTALYKREGSRVKEGDVICEISSIDLNNLYFEFQNTQNRLKVAKDVTQKDRELYKAGVISKREYQTSFLASQEMELKLKQIQATLKTFGIDTKQPRGKYGFRVVAKEDGILSVAPKNTGEKILAFTPYIRISKDSNMLARIKIPVNMSRYIKKGSLVLDENGKKVGSIQSISVVLDKDSNTILATALLTGGNFRVGEMVDLYVEGVMPQDSVIVPSDAVIKNDKDYLVFIQNDSGLMPTNVEIIEERDNLFILKNKNIKVGDKIAEGALIALKGIINDLGNQ